MRSLLVFFCLVPLWAQSPVLVELFTSEGCSSCPPADALLARLEKENSVIVLSEHVDYWDQLGWRDPFSNAQFTRRQTIYADRLNAKGNYTPQMVVDGRTEFVGSDSRRAASATAEAAQRPKIGVQVSSVDRNASQWTVHIDVPAIPQAAEVMVALVEPTAVTQVARGENGGRELKHVGVVRTLTPAGSMAKGVAFSKDVTIRSTGLHQRVVVFVQAKNQGAVLGTASLK